MKRMIPLVFLMVGCTPAANLPPKPQGGTSIQPQATPGTVLTPLPPASSLSTLGIVSVEISTISILVSPIKSALLPSGFLPPKILGFVPANQSVTDGFYLKYYRKEGEGTFRKATSSADATDLTYESGATHPSNALLVTVGDATGSIRQNSSGYFLDLPLEAYELVDATLSAKPGYILDMITYDFYNPNALYRPLISTVRRRSPSVSGASYPITYDKYATASVFCTVTNYSGEKLHGLFPDNFQIMSNSNLTLHSAFPEKITEIATGSYRLEVPFHCNSYTSGLIDLSVRIINRPSTGTGRIPEIIFETPAPSP